MNAPLTLLLCALAAGPGAAQMNAEAASAADGAGAASARPVPAFVSAPALSPPLSAPAGTPAAPLSAAAPSAVSPMPPSALIPVNPAALPAAGKHYTPSEWKGLVASTPGDGAKAILKSMSNAPASSPQVRIALADGEKLDGRFRGMNGNQMVFESAGKLIGLDRGNMDVTGVRRLVDVIFDGAAFRPAEVVVHDRPAVADPFKDLAAYKGRVVDMDIHDLDDPKWSRQTVSGRVMTADGESVQLQGPKGVTHVQREFHQIDAVSLRTEHYSSRGNVGTIEEINAKVPLGTPVELTLPGGKTAAGAFRGVQRDASGPYAVLEDAGGFFRGYRDFGDLRTAGYVAGGLMPLSEPLYPRSGQ
ncbi:MAG: hypothetical protein KGL74_05395 [Elusimicrobia bacterium]|nr:hypothetical protein [Elusimicrobiota bacterium]MDE2510537.1 hypothetical protein [Elusimicrobiota bacterium]